MRRTTMILWAAALTAGCTDYAGPSRPLAVYALARVGADHLPISLNGDGSLPFLVADTLRLVEDRPHTDRQILQQITVVRPGPDGRTTRSEAQFIYQIQNGRLVYDNCPIGSFCIASLVYAPRVFQIAGDSLFEVVPPGTNLQPHVYGLVRN